jgi:hypothetical protein
VNVSVQIPPGPPEAPPPPAQPPRDAKAELAAAKAYAKAELAAAKAYAKAERPWYKKKRYIGGGLLALLVIGSIAGSGSSTDTTSRSESDTASPSASTNDSAVDSSCTNKATDDCTPTVASNRAVRVDALTWSILGARAADTIGDQEYGMGEKADDTFLVVTIKVKSNKDESATISDDVIKLEASNGNSYSADSEGTIAVIGEGEESLLLETLGPDQSHTSKVVFDVPQSVLDGGAKLRFNELGFGETHGYIKLPTS